MISQQIRGGSKSNKYVKNHHAGIIIIINFNSPPSPKKKWLVSPTSRNRFRPTLDFVSQFKKNTTKNEKNPRNLIASSLIPQITPSQSKMYVSKEVNSSNLGGGGSIGGLNDEVIGGNLRFAMDPIMLTLPETPF